MDCSEYNQLVLFNLSRKLTKLPLTSLFSNIVPSGRWILLFSLATMMTVPLSLCKVSYSKVPSFRQLTWHLFDRVSNVSGEIAVSTHLDRMTRLLIQSNLNKVTTWWAFRWHSTRMTRTIKFQHRRHGLESVPNHNSVHELQFVIFRVPLLELLHLLEMVPKLDYRSRSEHSRRL